MKHGSRATKSIPSSSNLRYTLLWLGLACLGSSVIFLLFLYDSIDLIRPLLKAAQIWKVGLQSSLPRLQTDYPNYYWLAWLLTRGLVILVLAATTYLAIRLGRNQQQRDRLKKLQFPSWLCYTAHPSFYRNFWMHLFNLLGPLMALLLFYGLGKAYVDLAAEDWNMLQRSLARWYVLIIYAYLALLVLNQKVMVKQAAAEVLLPPSKAESLAVFRILFFTYVALFFIGKGSFYHDWIQANELSTIPLWGEASTLFGYIAPHYKTVYYLGIASSLLVAIGFYTRYLLLLNALLCFLVVATPNFFGKFWHNQIYIWIAWLFVASRCYDVWSVDAWWAKRRGKPFDTTPKIAYSIPIRWIWLHLGIIYFFAGIFKLWNSGFDWALSSSMINQIQTEWVQNYDQVPLPRIDHYPILVKIGGLCLILFEILFIFLLLKPATRLLAVLGGLSFHNLSAHYMYIGFSDLQYSYITFLHKIRRPFAFAPAPAPSQQSIWKNLKWSTTSMAFRIGLVVFSLNFLCGFFSIHTYPFSSYPTYSALVPDEIDLIHFVGFDEMGTEIDILAEAQKARFCRENCTIFETQIIEAWKNGQPVDTLVKNYWHLWRSNIPVLSEVKHLKVYYHRTPVQPERRQEYIINTLIYENRISVDRE